MVKYFEKKLIDRDSFQINVGENEIGFITYCEANYDGHLGSFVIEILFFDEENREWGNPDLRTYEEE